MVKLYHIGQIYAKQDSHVVGKAGCFISPRSGSEFGTTKSFKIILVILWANIIILESQEKSSW